MTEKVGVAPIRAEIEKLREYLRHKETCPCIVPGGTAEWVPRTVFWQGDDKVCTCGLTEVLADLARLERADVPRPEPEKGWQPIETAPRNVEALFWIVPKTAEETYVDTQGRPILSGASPPYRKLGRFGYWSSLEKAILWHALPADPSALADPRPVGAEGDRRDAATPPANCTSHYHLWQGPPLADGEAMVGWVPDDDQYCICGVSMWKHRGMATFAGYKTVRSLADPRVVPATEGPEK